MWYLILLLQYDLPQWVVQTAILQNAFYRAGYRTLGMH
jgi:hypothetical protein